MLGLAPAPEALVKYAALAPSPRNSQPWRFETGEGKISLYADLTRRARGADAGARDLYVSLGCALENLLIAASHFGYGTEVNYFPLSEEDELAAQVWLKPGGEAQRDPLFEAIGRRHTQDASAEGAALTAGALAALRATAADPSVLLLLTQEAPVRRAAEAMLARAGSFAHGNASYLEALAGCPPQRERIAFTGVPAFGLVSAAKAGRVEQLKAGRLLERLALKAALLGLAVQPLSLLLDAPDTAAALARLFRAGGVPLVPFRVGVLGPPGAAMPRRPIDEILR